MSSQRRFRSGAMTLAILGALFLVDLASSPAWADRNGVPQGTAPSEKSPDLGAPAPAPASPVTVTLRSDVASLRVGDRTTLHALAQVSSDFRARADRVFTWNVDLLALTPETALLVTNTLVRPVSDRDPVLGSVGLVDGPNLLGVRDSFLGRDGAGVAAPVELFTIQVQALAPGPVVFRLRAGTLGSDDSPDFLVLPLGDEDPWSGGDYTGASVTLQVITDSGSVPPVLRIERLPDARVRVVAEGSGGTGVALEETGSPADPASWRRIAQSPPGSTTVTHETTPGAGARAYRAVQ